MKIVDLEKEVVIEAIDIIPENYKIFEDKQIIYMDALIGQILLNDLKGQLLNIVEGAGLPVKQETAMRRMITNALHETHHDISKSLELVKI